MATTHRDLYFQYVHSHLLYIFLPQTTSSSFFTSTQTLQWGFFLHGFLSSFVFNACELSENYGCQRTTSSKEDGLKDGECTVM
ncbi:hypothetical protein MtrunA17_Chr2g0289691 [Medicago truncatula]|uniref:Uncharacterized protein n=1 Tax=Medicago truncatula TaxID=3880 RepID=A2Q1J4_MEDTR|nr:hypothetical protein MtrDRAFT_AC148915g21v2 [Medicago truncatula]RHN72612.1 hypothetical protein MtrunA17_Chr2g0289691 [Medicago truncatula]